METSRLNELVLQCCSYMCDKVFTVQMRFGAFAAHLNAPPSNLRALVKTTVFAGMFSPVEKVSVANNTCKHHKEAVRCAVCRFNFRCFEHTSTSQDNAISNMQLAWHYGKCGLRHVAQLRGGLLTRQFVVAASLLTCQGNGMAMTAQRLQVAPRRCIHHIIELSPTDLAISEELHNRRYKPYFKVRCLLVTLHMYKGERKSLVLCEWQATGQTVTSRQVCMFGTAGQWQQWLVA